MVRHSKRVQSQEEREKRDYHREVRYLKKWCNERGLIYKRWAEAQHEDICVLSRSEYDLGDFKQNCVEDNESYFLSPQGYEEWNEDV